MKVLKFVLNYLLLMLIPIIIVGILSFLFVFKYIDCVHSTTFITIYFFYSVLMLIGLGCSDEKEGMRIIN